MYILSKYSNKQLESQLRLQAQAPGSRRGITSVCKLQDANCMLHAHSTCGEGQYFTGMSDPRILGKTTPNACIYDAFKGQPTQGLRLFIFLCVSVLTRNLFRVPVTFQLSTLQTPLYSPFPAPPRPGQIRSHETKYLNPGRSSEEFPPIQHPNAHSPIRHPDLHYSCQ